MSEQSTLEALRPEGFKPLGEETCDLYVEHGYVMLRSPAFAIVLTPSQAREMAKTLNQLARQAA